MAQGKLDKAIDDATEAVRLDPKFDAAFANRGQAWLLMGRADEALVDFDEALRLEPRNSDVFIHRAFTQARRGESDLAHSDYAAALRLDPRNARAYLGRGELYEKAGQPQEALADFDKAIELSPENGAAHYHRSLLNSKTGKHEQALADLEEALRINPDDKNALCRRALVLAACPVAKFRNGNSALADARRACQLTEWKQPDMLGALAAACAEVGDFEKAVEWQTMAVDLLVNDETTAEFNTRLELYVSRKPWRDRGDRRSAVKTTGAERK